LPVPGLTGTLQAKAEPSTEETPDMTDTVGSGAFTFHVEPNWGKLPNGYVFGDVAAVGVDRWDRVYVFHRGKHPMVVFDRDGNFLRSWGDSVFTRAHGLHMGPDDTIWCTDDGDHTVRQCTLDGKILLQIGLPGKPAPYMSGEPFNRCTHTALSPKGEIYVSDGYGNARVHKYTPDGRLLLSWGEPGTDPGQFNIAHNITCDADGWVYVADRENHRVQVFDGNGRYETQWNNMHRPSGLFMTAGKCPLCYIGELGPHLPVNLDMPNIGPRVSVYDHTGTLLARVQADPPRGTAPGQFISPHGLAVDSRGDLYVGEAAYTSWPRSFPGVPQPDRIRCLQKLVRVEANP
jgi:DNA-binding beta-propeller fold protein YncE